jgi:CRISPR/Cas system CMR-associated protein Cmr1 (group 7 of RAMP superfamily)
MRFWYRAVAAPLLGYDYDLLARHETQLFGSVHNGTSTTFRMALETRGWKESNDELYCPHDPKKGSGPAAAPGTEMLLSFSRRIPAFPEANQAGALAAALWLATNLGAVGKRARRGAGSLALSEWTSGDSYNLPAGRAADLDELRAQLTQGFTQALRLIQGHCGNQGRTAAADSFSVVGCQDIYVGTHSFATEGELRRAISAATHSFLQQHGRDYGQAMGHARSKDRLASPLFIRISVVGNGRDQQYYPVMTWSQSRDPRTAHVTDAFRDRFKAKALCRSHP